MLREVLGAVQATNGATMVGLEALGPALRSPRGSGTGILSADGNLSQAFDGLADHSDEIDKALARLDDARQALAGLTVDEGRALSLRAEDLEIALRRLSQGLGLMRDLAPVGAELVGAHSTKRYLILGQSADELRATGGFVSALWLVTFENGALLDVQYHDAVRVDDWDRLMLYPPAPLGLEDHMNAHVWLLRDVSWEPDFPTTARTAADLFRLGQRRDVDGVAAINQWLLLAAACSSEAPSPTPSPQPLGAPDGQGPITSARVVRVLDGVTLARIHRRTALGTALEEASGCSSESGIMVLEQKPARKQGAPNRCCHRTNPTVSASSLTTIAWWPMPACSCRPP